MLSSAINYLRLLYRSLLNFAFCNFKYLIYRKMRNCKTGVYSNTRDHLLISSTLPTVKIYTGLGSFLYAIQHWLITDNIALIIIDSIARCRLPALKIASAAFSENCRATDSYPPVGHRQLITTHWKGVSLSPSFGFNGKIIGLSRPLVFNSVCGDTMKTSLARKTRSPWYANYKGVFLHAF